MIFVSVGTERFPFDRLVRAVDDLAVRLDGEPVFVQLGHCTYQPQRCQWTTLLPYRDLMEQLSRARIVVSHAGTGIVLLCARLGKIPIVVPRRRCFGEHVDDHQLELAQRMAQAGVVLLAERSEELGPLVINYERRAATVRSRPHVPPVLASALSEYLQLSDPGESMKALWTR